MPRRRPGDYQDPEQVEALVDTARRAADRENESGGEVHRGEEHCGDITTITLHCRDGRVGA